MKDISIYLLTVLTFIFIFMALQIFGQALIELQIYNFVNYSWWEWTLQIIYWVSSLLIGIIAAEDALN